MRMCALLKCNGSCMAPCVDAPRAVQIIGAEKFEMPPPKRIGRIDDHGHAVHAHRDLYDAHGDLAAHGGALGDCYADSLGLGGSMGAGGPVLAAPQSFRTLQMSDAGQLQRGTNVKVYRADERWHEGVLENVRPPHLKLSMTVVCAGAVARRRAVLFARALGLSTSYAAQVV